MGCPEFSFKKGGRVSKESKSVSLPAEVYSRIEEMVKDTGFGSVDEYVLFILGEVLKEERDRLLSMKQEVDPRQIEELERTKSWLRFWKDTQKELSLGLSMIPDEDGEELPDQRQLIKRSFQGVWNIAEIDNPELAGKLGFPTSKRQLLDYFQTEISVHKDYVELRGIIPLDGIIPIEARKNTVLTRDQEGASSAPGHRQILPGCHR